MLASWFYLIELKVIAMGLSPFLRQRDINSINNMKISVGDIVMDRGAQTHCDCVRYSL